MGQRPRHQRKELETILLLSENQGWTVEKGKSYFKMKCPCPEKHWKTVHLTPSGRHYELSLRTYLKNRTCWKEEGR